MHGGLFTLSLAGCAVAAATSIPAVAAPADSPRVASTVLDLRFDGRSGAVVNGSNIVNSGTAATTHDVLTRGTAVAGEPTQRPRAVFRPGVNTAAGTAARLPGWVAADQDPPLAIVAVNVDPSITDASADPLNPGAGAFSWHTDFRLDAENGGGPADGDNLMQRGLSPAVLWKLEVDRGRVGCVVRAADPAGVISQSATPPIRVVPSKWHRATCSRTADSSLVLTVEEYRGGVWRPFGTSTAPTKVVGSLAMNPAIPVSVGGKLRDSTTIVPAVQNPSQFNGIVDNAVLSIG